MLAGCARFQSQPLSPDKTAADMESRSLADPALKTFLEQNLHRQFTNWPAASWDFDTLTLVAFYYHPDLAVARAQWNVANAGVKTAGGVPNPTLSLTPGYNVTSVNAAPGLTPWFPAVNFDLPVETAGKRRHRITTAERLSESARLNIATVAWQVRSRLRRSLLDLYAAREAESLLQQQAAAATEVARSMNSQLAAGEVSPFEATQARIALGNSRIALFDAERQRAEAHAQVASALGLPASAIDDAALSFAGLTRPPAGPPPTPELRRQTLLNRADILGALADYAATESTLQLEIAKQYPDVHFNPGYQYDQGDNKWSLGITFELPVLNQNQGPIAEAKAKRNEAAARFNALQAGVVSELDLAIAVYQASEKNLSTLEALGAAQAKQREAVAAQLKAGAADQLDLANAQIELGAAE